MIRYEKIKNKENRIKFFFISVFIFEKTKLEYFFTSEL